MIQILVVAMLDSTQDLFDIFPGSFLIELWRVADQVKEIAVLSILQSDLVLGSVGRQALNDIRVLQALKTLCLITEVILFVKGFNNNLFTGPLVLHQLYASLRSIWKYLDLFLLLFLFVLIFKFFGEQVRMLTKENVFKCI